MAGLELYIGGTVLLLGAAFTLLASVRVIRLPDLYACRVQGRRGGWRTDLAGGGTGGTR